MRSILKFLGASGLAIAALPAAAALNVFACEPEWGRSRAGAGRGQGVGVFGDDCAAGPAPYRGATQPDRTHPFGRPADLLGSGAGNRMASPAAPRRAETARSSSDSGISEALAVRHQLEGPVRSSTGPSATSIREANPHITRTPATSRSPFATALEERLAQLDPANAGTYHSRA